MAQDTAGQKINLVENYGKFGEREQLGSEINSLYDEHHPVISPDGKYLFVNRYGNPDNIGGTKDKGDIWISEFKNGKWMRLQNMGKPLNDKETNYICGISADNKTMLVGNVYRRFLHSSRPGLSISYKGKKKWSKPEAVNMENYYTYAPFTSACISANKNIIILSLAREGKKIDVDMYVSFRKKGNIWTEPKYMGPILNSLGDDYASYLAPDGKTLYFFSDGYPGYGSSDIFISKRLDDSWLRWSTPQNLGPRINSKRRDSFFSVSAKGDYAYFSSSKPESTDLDIYRIELPKTAAPDPVVLIRGKVFNDKTKQPLNCQIKIVDSDSEKTVRNFESTGDSGNFTIIVHTRGKYEIAAIRSGFISIHKTIDIPEIKKYAEIEMEIFLTPLETGQTIILANIFFEPNKADLLPTSYEELNKLVGIMKDNPGIKIQVSGHTSANQEGEQFNTELSSSRALSVKNYLVEKGIEELRVAYKGYGFSKPIYSQSDEEHQAMNRRVEFTIIAK